MNVNVSNAERDRHPAEAQAVPRPATLNEADLAILHKSLGQGLAGFARQGDIVELHKRIGEKFEKLPPELFALGQEHRESVLSRIDALESSLNGLEAALRIELPPLLTQTIIEATQQAAPRRRGVFLKFLLMLLFTGGGLALGAFYHAPIMEFAARIPGYLSF